jgi:carbon storage regulator CsrA
MLILSRKAGEAVVIDGGLRVSVLGTDGRTVRLGIDAPADTRILRAEIVDEVRRVTVAALAQNQDLLALAPVKVDR